ncbi:MAG: hypothetical protein QF357_09720, partial [Dehalococcoidia bacterium]|nr:hypothetical protein [Dehalococcoidia bacterium]
LMMHAAHVSPLLKRSRWLLLVVFAAMFALVVACGDSDSASDDPAPAAGGDDELSKVSTTLMADQTFTFDDYVAAGWKKSR